MSVKGGLKMSFYGEIKLYDYGIRRRRSKETRGTFSYGRSIE